ncbi:hypothetical protein OQA88_4554 [Cercophora sp. LCS_1]
MRQIEVRARNGKLKNPIARIRPIPIFVPGVGAQDPDPAYFPGYVDQLYVLRKPQKESDRKMLAYLSKFYDIWHEASASRSDEEEAKVDPERAVEPLEEILGLDEENFTRFRTRAQQFADQGPPAAPSDGSPTVPFTETPSRAPPRGPAPPHRVPFDGSPTIPFTETPSRAAPERLLAARAAPQHNDSRLRGDGEQLD